MPAGDVLAFYGNGIPLDIPGAGTDIVSYPATTRTVQGTTITLGDASITLYSHNRTYSFAARRRHVHRRPALTEATATAYGGVTVPDGVALITPGSGYTNPTVDFDQPDYFDGVKAVAHAVTTDDDSWRRNRHDHGHHRRSAGLRVFIGSQCRHP